MGYFENSGPLRRGLCAGGLAIALIGMAGVAGAEIDREQARADMREIYASIRLLMPLSVDEKAFADPKNQERIREALSKLAERAEHVADHVGSKDRRIQYLGGSLSRESGETAHVFGDTLFQTKTSWPHKRRVVYKAEVVRLEGRAESIGI